LELQPLIGHVQGVKRRRPEGDDFALWTRAGQDDSEAFSELFERHARTVYNFCFRRTADWSLAEDLTSIVFLEAWRHRKERLERPSAVPLLLGIALNVLRNRARSVRRYRAALERVPRSVEAPDFADDVAGRIDDERRMELVLRRVKDLPPTESEVLELCVWAGLSYEDAAAALEVPIGTVRSRLARARSHLRELTDRPGHERKENHALTRAALDRSEEERA
jgi:RNA polymerase sigma-70 factor (ECF subfamily)